MNRHFEQYITEIDSYMKTKCGFTTTDLQEYDYFSDYSSGVSVEECAARAALAAEGN